MLIGVVFGVAQDRDEDGDQVDGAQSVGNDEHAERARWPGRVRMPADELERQGLALETFGPVAKGGQKSYAHCSGLMPAALMISALESISSRMSSSNCSGLIGKGSAPSLARRSRTSGVCKALSVA